MPSQTLPLLRRVLSALGGEFGVRVRSQFFGHKRFVMAEGIEHCNEETKFNAGST